MGSNRNITSFVEEAKLYDPLLLWGVLREAILPQVSMWNLLLDKTKFVRCANGQTSTPAMKLRLVIDEFQDVVEHMSRFLSTCCETAVKEEANNHDDEDVVQQSEVVMLSDQVAELVGSSFRCVRLKTKGEFPDEYKCRFFKNQSTEQSNLLDIKQEDYDHGDQDDQDEDDDDDYYEPDKSLEFVLTEGSEEIKTEEAVMKLKMKVEKNTKKTKEPPPVECPKCLKPFKTKYQRQYHFRSKACPGYVISPRIHKHKKHGAGVFCIHPDCLPEGTQETKDTTYYPTKEDFFKHCIPIHYPHMELTHECETCSEKFPFVDMLQHHIKASHDRKQFTCITCGAMLTSKQALKKHERIHTGEKPYMCDKCDYRCAGNNGLRDHKKRLHSEVDVNTNICHLCGKGFFRPHSLKEHMFTHSDIKRFSCKICGRQLKNDSCYRRHMVCVHGQKVTCDLCGRDFSCRQGLKLHKSQVHGILY